MPSAKSISVCDQVMSTDINDLPQGIIASVFQLVPFSTIGQCRAVCKEWNSLIMNPEFSCQFEKLDFPKPVLVANDPVEGWSVSMHNSESDLWVPVSLPFLQDAPQVSPHYLTASSGGLMCFETHDRRSFIISNPVTRTWRYLQLPVVEDDFDGRTCSCLNPLYCRHYSLTKPYTSDVLTTLTGLIVDEQAGRYKLVVASLAESRERRTFLFDSLTLSWTRGAQMPMGTKFLNAVALTLDHNLYCLLDSDAGKRVAKYDAEHDTWCCSNPLGGDVAPTFFGGIELDLVGYNDGVKVLAKEVGREYRYRHFYTPIRSSFSNVKVLSVLESPGRMEVRGLMWPNRINWTDLHITHQLYSAFRDIDGSKFSIMASAASASSAGHGKTLYVFGVVDFSNEACMLHVLKVDGSIDCASLLASLGQNISSRLLGFQRKQVVRHK